MKPIRTPCATASEMTSTTPDQAMTLVMAVLIRMSCICFAPLPLHSALTVGDSGMARPNQTPTTWRLRAFLESRWRAAA